jgi:hypothetical protein
MSRAAFVLTLILTAKLFEEIGIIPCTNHVGAYLMSPYWVIYDEESYQMTILDILKGTP